jgi:hypothetical protein
LGESADSVAVAEEATELPAPARLEPERYRVQFTAGEEYVKLVEHAQALLSHSAGRVPLDELALRAMRALVAELEKDKRAATKRPARAAYNPANEVEASVGSAGPEHPRQRGRRVPAAVRRAVFERDQSRCAYLDDSGQRCRETHHLELHHLKPFAMGGEHTLANLALRCRAHNALAAEDDFGADFIEQTRDSRRHESQGRQTDPETVARSQRAGARWSSITPDCGSSNSRQRARSCTCMRDRSSRSGGIVRGP